MIASYAGSAVAASALLLALATVGAVVDGVLDTGPGARPGRPLWEVARLLRQRRRTTVAPDALLWRIGLVGPLVVALLMTTVIPLGGLVVSDLPAGLVWFNAMDVLLWAVLWLAGWGPNGVYGLVGAYRFVAQALGYELPLMFALTAPAVAAGSLRVGDIVAAQRGLWFVVEMPLAFVVFVGAVVAFTAWGPLGYPVDRDIANGLAAEPSGVDRLVLLAGRYALLAAGSGMAVALFLGGGSGPVLPGWLWSLVKIVAVLTLLVAVRRRLPTVRADRVMRLFWLVVLPATLLQVLVVSVIVLVRG